MSSSSKSESVSVGEVLETLDELAPFDRAVEGDKVGLVGGSESLEVSRVLVCLDLTPDLASKVPEDSLVVSHHPVPEPLRDAGFPIIVAHSNWDSARGALALAEFLGLEDVERPHDLAALGSFDGTLPELLDRVARLDPPELRVVEATVDASRVLVVPGFGLSRPDFVELAAEVGARVVVSGDLTHHVALRARLLNVSCVDATHAATELPGLRELRRELDERLPVEVELVDPRCPWGIEVEVQAGPSGGANRPSSGR